MSRMMTNDRMIAEQALRENADLRFRLEEAEETIRAIRSGEVDAFVVQGGQGDEVFTLETADRPYRLFVESMQQGAVTLAEDGTILFCNRYFVNLLNVPAERVAGTKFREWVAEVDRKSCDPLGLDGQGEAHLLREDGIRVPVGVSRHSLAYDSRETLVCLLVTDLTQQKLYEELKRTQEELRETAERLSDADRRKDEFLATLAHELRNPLAPIRTGLEVMKMIKDDPTTLAEVRDTMQRQTEQLITLVDDLLDVSRITQGKLELRMCRVRLSDVVHSAVEASESLIAEAGHNLTVALPDEPVFLNADPHRLAQVLANLLNNASKYTPDGGQIRLSAQREESEVLLSVKDTGIGIPANMQDRIFEMFSQIDQPLEKSYTGLGIGLSLVKSLVEMHGGRIEVQSEGASRGSEFRIHLPMRWDGPVQDQIPTPADPKSDALVKRRVLIVDDNEAAAKMLSLIVKTLGHEVRTAGDGQAAIRLASEFLPELVLMDLGMPKMDGYAAARHIRGQSWGESMTLVALSGWGQDDAKRKTKEAGFDHHLIKPAEPAELLKLLREPKR